MSFWDQELQRPVCKAFAAFTVVQETAACYAKEIGDAVERWDMWSPCLGSLMVDFASTSLGEHSGVANS